MSTILKALRRLEEQKAESAPRPLRDEVVLVPKRTRTRSGLAVALGAALAFAAIGGGLWWWLDRAPAESAAPAAPPAPVIAVEAPTPPAPPSSVPTPQPAAAPAPAAPAQVAQTAEEAAAANTMAPEYAMAAREAAERAAAEQARNAAPDFEVVRPAQPKRPPSARGLDAAPPQALSKPSADLAPPAAESAADDDFATAPVTRSKSPIRVERTQWHPNPERRIAWVEVEGVTALREVREGERVGPYTVRAIEPAAVLFADGSVELRREVGR